MCGRGVIFHTEQRMADEKTCTVICVPPGGLTLTERAPLHAMDSAPTRVQLKYGKNEGISRAFIERWAGDPGLSITKVPFLNYIFIDKA